MVVWQARIALAALLAALIPVVSLAQSETITTNQTLDDCQLIPDDGARLACYDRVIKAGRANVVSQQPSGGGGAGASGGAASSAPATVAKTREEREQEFGLPQYETREAERARGEVVDEITAEVVDTRAMSGGKLRFVLSNGMVWDQTEGAPPQAPKPGTEITIRRNFMGGHICKLDRWTSVRCTRVQ